MFLTTRWFPPILALTQVIRHVAMVGYPYWLESVHFGTDIVADFVRRDLAQPFFEMGGTGSCAGIQHHSTLWIDVPAYVAAALLHSAMSGEVTCVDVTPRGQIVTAAFVPVFWFLTGFSIRRLAQRRWRGRVDNRFLRTILWFGLVPLPLGFLMLAILFLSILVLLVLLFVSFDASLGALGATVRTAGFMFWIFYLSVLSAERLRIMPFATLELSSRSKSRT